ncbi:TPA: triphosphoribosyl-dephospho-CoA synthase, partial [Legionella pneumophila]
MQTFQHSLPNPYKIARYFAKKAVQALYDEVALYPKPGLVSFIDSGAHQDMNGALFFRSLFGLRHYFFQIGLHTALGSSPKKLVTFGLNAEKTMLKITGGVNTHRGAIFALGILCTSICKLSAKYHAFSTEDLHYAVIEQWAQYLEKEHQNRDTHGTLVTKRYAVPDAKQTAIQGYKAVFHTYNELSNIIHDQTFFGL